MNERDTHFAGFAKLLYDKVEDIVLSEDAFFENWNSHISKEGIIAMELVITQGLYAFAEHIVSSPIVTECEGPTYLNDMTPEERAEVLAEMVREIPDLTQWTEEREPINSLVTWTNDEPPEMD